MRTLCIITVCTQFFIVALQTAQHIAAFVTTTLYSIAAYIFCFPVSRAIFTEISVNQYYSGCINYTYYPSLNVASKLDNNLSRHILRVLKQLLDKLGYIAKYEGRTKNKELEQMIKKEFLISKRNTEK